MRSGARVNVENEDGLTPLMAAKTVDMARLLVAWGADPYYKNKNGGTVFARKDSHSADILAYLKTLPHKLP